MNWARVEKLIANCSKQPANEDQPRDLALGDYAEVLGRFNGIEGFIGRAQYVSLWTVDQIRELNAAYEVRKYAPGITLIGTDGGDTGFGVDGASNRYVTLPLVGMSLESASDAGGSFDEFLGGLADE